MKQTIYILTIAVLAAVFTPLTSCNKWLDVSSSQEIFGDDAFADANGYRNALIGVYKTAASESLWGQELSWGFLSAMSWNYASGYAIPKYRNPLNYGEYTDASTRGILEGIWSKSYNAIANCNALLAKIESEEESSFEYGFEKNMIMAEARGMRALLHFQLLQLFAPAPVTGKNDMAIPYVTAYPDILPSYSTVNQVIDKVLEDLKYAEETLYSIDVETFFNNAHFMAGTTNLMSMHYFLFWAVGNYNSTGEKTDNAMGDGFFAYRGYRFNYWSALALQARVYSYARNFTEAERYADMILEKWTGANEEGTALFKLNNTNRQPSTSYGTNQIDTKRLPEPLLAFWNDNLPDIYATAAGTTYNRLVEPKYLFEGDEETDYRYTVLYNSDTYKYRVWDGQDPAFNTNNDVIKYSNPLTAVIELPEIYYIKAECQAQKGDIAGAVATVKKVRDARGCTALQSAEDFDSFMELLVNEAQRDFLTRGTTFQFLKKLDWKEMYNGTPAGKTLPDGWYVMPIPESEIAYY